MILKKEKVKGPIFSESRMTNYYPGHVHNKTYFYRERFFKQRMCNLLQILFSLARLHQRVVSYLSAYWDFVN